MTLICHLKKSEEKRESKTTKLQNSKIATPFKEDLEADIASKRKNWKRRVIFWVRAFASQANPCLLFIYLTIFVIYPRSDGLQAANNKV